MASIRSRPFPPGRPIPNACAARPAGSKVRRHSPRSCALLAVELGARPLALDGANRALYHAAAVFASNYAIALLSAASEIWSAAGLPEPAARPALAALLAGAVANARELPLERALSGPVARGDADTVGRHLDALAPEPALAALYRALGARLLELDLPLSAEQRARLREALA